MPRLRGYLPYTSKKSSIVAYKPGPKNITVQFDGGKRYTYSHKSAGARRVKRMKTYAKKNSGLNAYINKRAALHYE